MTAAKTIPIRRLAPAPAHLKDAGRLHWERVVSMIMLDPDELSTLQAAAELYDDAAAFRADVLKRGVMVCDRFGILRPNASADFARKALAEAAAQNQKLGLYSAEARPAPSKGYY